MPSFIFSTYPPRLGGQPSSRGLHGLSVPGVYLANTITCIAGELLPHHCTHHPDVKVMAGLFSVALAVTLNAPAFNKQRAALYCPDFPTLKKIDGSDCNTKVRISFSTSRTILHRSLLFRIAERMHPHK